MAYSASKLKDYKFCPQRYHYTYDLGLIQPKNESLYLGIKYHSMMEKFYNKEQLDELDPIKDKTLIGLLRKNEENPIEGQIIDTEKRFEIYLEDICIRGIFDRLDTDKTIDYKTTSKDYTLEDVDNFQTDIYILARYMLYGDLLPMVYHVNNKKKINTKKYKPQVIVVEKKQEDLEDLKNKIVEEIRKIERKEFSPNPGEHCFYCPYGPNPYFGTGNCKSYKYAKKRTKKSGDQEEVKKVRLD